MKKSILLLFCILLPLILTAQNKKKRVQLIRPNGEAVSPEYDDISIRRDGNALFSVDNKVGILDSLGQVLLPPTFDYNTIKKNNTWYAAFFPYNKEGKCALTNSRFQVLTPFVYDFLEKTYSGLIIGVKGEYYGVIDSLGNELTPFIYDGIYGSTSDFALNQKDGKTGVVYKNGKQVLPLIDSSIYLGRNANFNNREYGLVAVEIDEKCGIIDSTGRVIIPFIYERIGQRHDCDLIYLLKQEKTFTQEAQEGLIDKQGHTILPPIYEKVDVFDKGIIAMKDSVDYFFDLQGNLKLASDKGIWKSGFACVATMADPVLLFYDCDGKQLHNIEKDPSRPATDYWIEYEDRKLIGYKDRLTDEIVIPAQYDETDYFRDRIGSLDIIVTQKKKKGIIGSDGNMLLPIEYQDIEPLNETRCLLKMDGKWAFADYNGNLFKGSEFTKIVKLDNDRCVLIKGNKAALADYDGNLLTGYEFDNILTIRYQDTEGISRPSHLYAVFKGKYCGIITRQGKELVPCIYNYDLRNVDFFEVMGGGNIRMQKDGKYGLLDQNTGQVLLSCEYDRLTQESFNLIRTQKGNQPQEGRRWGITDQDGKEILPCIYPKTPGVLKNGIVVAKEEEKCRAVDLKGNIVFPREYNSIGDYHDDILLVTWYE